MIIKIKSAINLNMFIVFLGNKTVEIMIIQLRNS